MNYLEELAMNWNAFGEEDPLWAILTVPEKKGNKWDLEEFFFTGVKEIESVIKDLERIPLPKKWERALDFGCGVGRVTQALCQYFQFVDGVDIAPSMIRKAEQLNRFKERCHYHLNQSDTLRIFEDETFDFCYSNITLQHIQPVYTKRYLKELMRVLRVGGFLMFQLPSEFCGNFKIEKSQGEELHNSQMCEMLADSKKEWKDSFIPRMEMYGIPLIDVINELKDLGVILEIKHDTWAGKEWIGYRYLVGKFVIHPAKIYSHYAMGSNYERKGSFKKAKEKFEYVIKYAKDIPSLADKNKLLGGAHFHLGCIYQKIKDKEKAKWHYKECLKFIPNHRKAEENLEKLHC